MVAHWDQWELGNETKTKLLSFIGHSHFAFERTLVLVFTAFLGPYLRPKQRKLSVFFLSLR
jgi:hypothetical protein